MSEIEEIDLSTRAETLLTKRNNSTRYIIEEPTSARPSMPLGMDPLTFILMLPFLPFYLIFNAIGGGSATQRRLAVTEIEKTPTGGWKIFEYER